MAQTTIQDMEDMIREEGTKRAFAHYLFNGYNPVHGNAVLYALRKDNKYLERLQTAKEEFFRRVDNFLEALSHSKKSEGYVIPYHLRALQVFRNDDFTDRKTAEFMFEYLKWIVD